MSCILSAVSTLSSGLKRFYSVDAVKGVKFADLQIGPHKIFSGADSEIHCHDDLIDFSTPQAVCTPESTRERSSPGGWSAPLFP